MGRPCNRFFWCRFKRRRLRVWLVHGCLVWRGLDRTRLAFLGSLPFALPLVSLLYPPVALDKPWKINKVCRDKFNSDRRSHRMKLKSSTDLDCRQKSRHTRLREIFWRLMEVWFSENLGQNLTGVAISGHSGHSRPTSARIEPGETSSK